MFDGIVGHSMYDAVDHASPLVRYCAKYDFHNGRDIFAAVYLSKQPGAEALDWGPEARNLDESLVREEKSFGERGQDYAEEE
jgi:hypothetical protein